MSLEKIEALEKELAYKTKAKTIEAKRIEIEARWKASGKCDVELLQTVANSWRNGAVKVTFVDATIQIKFVSVVGIPDDLSTLKYVIDETKPAHLPVEYSFMYRTWGMLLPRRWGQVNNKFTWKELREKKKYVIDETKPAHLPVEYSFMYRTWGMLLPRRWGQVNNKFTWKELREKKGV